MIVLKNLYKTFYSKDKKTDALNGVSLTVNDGDIFGVIGYSGAGKSTLLRCINLLECPDSGEISVNGKKLAWTCEDGKFVCRSNHEMKAIRKSIGMIFQHFNLLDRSTVFENIAYPLRYSRKSKKEIYSRVEELLELVNLKDKKDCYPCQLSGGQKQRVAIARALANRPEILLSDEATSALDPESTESILQLLKELNKKLKITIVLITHEMEVIKEICNKVAVMEKGKIIESGNVYDIFAAANSETCKKIIAGRSPLSKVEKLIKNKNVVLDTNPYQIKSKLVKLQFRKEAVGDCLISNISKKYLLDVNIILANIDLIQGSPLGELIVEIKGEEKNINEALDFIKSEHINIFDFNAEFLGWEVL